MALLGGLFVIGLEILVLHSLFPLRWAYVWLFASAFSVVCLMIAMLPLRSRSSGSLYAGMFASAVLTITGIAMLVEITPTAQRNNDSGEIFWFIMIPIIIFFMQASAAYSKIAKSRPTEVTPWPR